MREDLLFKISNNDIKAFQILYDRYFERLFVFAKAFLKSSELAEEAISDVFVKVWEARIRLTEVENVDAYLYKSVKNHCLTILSQKARKPKMVSIDSIKIFPGTGLEYYPETNILVKELHEKLDSAVASLPVRCRLAFRLVREEGLCYKEAATILCISPKAIEKQMVRAHKHLRLALRKYLNLDLPRKFKRRA
ncbi:RNA polymerase sigma-70 factor [Echinicola pacifica]|uniref:RNA polymerase sigma-70 factor n=1 Tax=Echinicola pacifica TaxID=346377 RepID=A0A918PZY8_9BACT|nr:RNA polymerase sigma-70 factor [Echinicola pacifica]GGZ28909.1 RNA polymerase sigma-70 factor [Echinicola pacifica]